MSFVQGDTQKTAALAKPLLVTRIKNDATSEFIMHPITMLIGKTQKSINSQIFFN